MLHHLECTSGLTWNLSCNCAADLRLCVFQELHERWNKVSVDNLLVDRFRNLDRVSVNRVLLAIWTHLLKSICNHVSHPPALVFE